MRGTVTEFDEARGLGEIRSDDGRTFGFHCVEIADGTRTIAVGARAEFRAATGRRGLDEAYSVRSL